MKKFFNSIGLWLRSVGIFLGLVKVSPWDKSHVKKTSKTPVAFLEVGAAKRKPSAATSTSRSTSRSRVSLFGGLKTKPQSAYKQFGGGRRLARHWVSRTAFA